MKQLAYAMSITEKYNNEKDDTTHKEKPILINESNENRLSNFVRHITMRLAWHDNK